MNYILSYIQSTGLTGNFSLTLSIADCCLALAFIRLKSKNLFLFVLMIKQKKMSASSIAAEYKTNRMMCEKYNQ